MALFVPCCPGCPVCKNQATPDRVQIDIEAIGETSTPPPYWSSCGNCDALNATYLVGGYAGDGYHFGGPVEYAEYCLWTSFYSPDPPNWRCGAGGPVVPIRVTDVWLWIIRSQGLPYTSLLDGGDFNVPAGHFYIAVTMNCGFAWPYEGPYIAWVLDLGAGKPDCMRFDHLTVPFFSYYDSTNWAGLACDPTASTCRVTALSNHPCLSAGNWP